MVEPKTLSQPQASEPAAWQGRDRPHDDWSFLRKAPGVGAWAETRPLYTSPQPALAVKGLEWWKSDTGDWCADTLVGRYQVQKVTSNRNYRLFLPGRSKEVVRPDTIYWPEDAAKAAAQADYETRIRSALVASPPSGEVEGEEVRRAANALLGNLWCGVVDGTQTHDENWNEFDRRYPGVKWLRDALSVAPATADGWREDRLPTHEEFKTAMAVIFACNGFDLSQWTDDIWPDEGLETVAKYMRQALPAAPTATGGR